MIAGGGYLSVGKVATIELAGLHLNSHDVMLGFV